MDNLATSIPFITSIIGIISITIYNIKTKVKHPTEAIYNFITVLCFFLTGTIISLFLYNI